MPLKSGRWMFNEDGNEMTLELSGDLPEGKIVGQILRPAPLPPLLIDGIWEETSRILVFSPTGNFETKGGKFYKGFLLSTPRNPTLGQDFIWTLTGFVQYTDLRIQERDEGFRSPKRTMFGWFAQIREIA